MELMIMEKEKILDVSRQVVGNIGLYFVCYELSKRNWNCLPTSRNAKGVDIVIYSQNAKSMHTIQVKSLSKKNAVSLDGSKHIIADFLVICVNVMASPELYVLTRSELEGQKLHESKHNGKTKYFLQFPQYKDFIGGLDKIRDDSGMCIQ